MHDNRRQMQALVLGPFEQRTALHIRQAKIENQASIAFGPQRFQGLLPGGGLVHVDIPIADELLHPAAHRVVIFHDQHAFGFLSGGFFDPAQCLNDLLMA